jgi:hypothetical protein
MLLPITMTATDALLDTLGIPRQIVIHDEGAKLKVDPLRSCFCGYHDTPFFTEIIHKC